MVLLAETIIGSAAVETPPGVGPETPLVLPRARSALVQYSRGGDGTPMLTLYHGAKEVSFDDPVHFAFAHRLAKGEPFRAADAAAWGDIGWLQAQEMLSALLAEGVLAIATGNEPAAERHDNMPMPSPLPPAPMSRARSWMDAESLMLELTGSELDIAYLELVVPIFRTGHLFVDRDGRQVGEANVFPATARIDVPTDWRGCPYAGNRYQAEKPMNVTALRAMRKHWRQVMALAANVRAAYLDRFPEARNGWTVGDVERLAVAVLALPSFLMLRCDAPLANGELHPALSNLFRVTDGLRMVMHQMLFLPLHEQMKRPDQPITTGEILDYADRNYSFHSDHGVCAGPRFMVEDFLGVLLDGVEPQGGFDPRIAPELVAAIECIEPAFDYAMRGLQAYGAVFSLWPAMTRTYEALHRLLESKAAAASPGASGVARRFQDHFDALSFRSFLASEEWREHREAVYDDMFARCTAAVSGSKPSMPLSATIAPVAASEEQPREALAAAVSARFGKGSEKLSGDFAGLVMEFLQRGQRIVVLAECIQAETAALLHRPAPGHRLSLQQLNLHNVLMGEDVRTVPFLPDELSELFGIDIHVGAQAIEIRERPAAASASHSPDVTIGE